MDDLIRSIEDRLFTAQDTVCLDRARLTTEAYAEHEGKPAPLMRAAAFRHILRHMTLDLRSNPPGPDESFAQWFQRSKIQAGLGELKSVLDRFWRPPQALPSRQPSR